VVSFSSAATEVSCSRYKSASESTPDWHPWSRGPTDGDPSAHHQQQAIGTDQQTIAQKIRPLDGSQRLFDPRSNRGGGRTSPRIVPQQVIGYIGKVSLTELYSVLIRLQQILDLRVECLAGGAHSQLCSVTPDSRGSPRFPHRSSRSSSGSRRGCFLRARLRIAPRLHIVGADGPLMMMSSRCSYSHVVRRQSVAIAGARSSSGAEYAMTAKFRCEAKSW